MRTMIVDDNKSFREALKYTLNRKSDYKVVAEAENGKQALELLRKNRPDLILMDIEMPVMNGIEATKLILWKNPKIIVIAVTMYQDKAYLTELIGAGFKACIFKNNIDNELSEAINCIKGGSIYMPTDIKL